jgi:hypothetical protein
MDDAPNFEIKVEGIRPTNFIKLEGERGPFFITDAGGRPELEYGFFYGDDKYQFCFYVGQPPNVQNPKILDTVIFSATTQRLGRGKPFIAELEDVEYLERNIRRLFDTRFFFDLRREVKAPYTDIRFTWRIAK